MSSNVADHPHSTKAGDVYNFGVMAFEVLVDSFLWERSVYSFETGIHGTTPAL